MPSLHVGWALLIYWHARALGAPARIAGAIWLVSTIVATLAMGQHYFIDLVVAVPFAALIDALAAGGAPAPKISARGWVIATAVLLLVVWYAILFLSPPGASGGFPLLLLAVATVAGSWAAHARWSAQR
jgi:hypothetical protein